jgi:hypothetical protein
MSICEGGGQFGNQIVRGIAQSIIAKKFDLDIKYQGKEDIEQLGFKLFVGNKTYDSTRTITDNDYTKTLYNKSINYNIKTDGYFQTYKISTIIHNYLQSDIIVNTIVSNNIHKDRYKNNNDCFVHIRLGDVEHYNPGFKYYDSIISKLTFNTLYIASNDLNHIIVKRLQHKYSNTKIYNTSLPDIMIFGSTCKYVILSYGTFSASIGYLSYYSYVYCLEFSIKYAWDWYASDECDMFRDKYSKISKWIIHTKF